MINKWIKLQNKVEVKIQLGMNKNCFFCFICYKNYKKAALNIVLYNQNYLSTFKK